ncbi:putative bifunctional diguanylate cyclase/phosphodiesterase [Amphritea sp. HPY]|uniref:putative bifunctional diguanylate cyclase/phosphodiesterase n=1 Tax=Amphritea sp. HPY TaxID=3421652 RepID=UPI003D7EB1AF
MMNRSTNDFLHNNVTVLKSRVSRAAFQGVLIAIAALIAGTFLACFFADGSVTLSGIMEAQRTNYALWVLDAVPFAFGFWGQYASTIIAYEASALVIDQTRELRDKADDFEKKAQHSSTHDILTDLPNKALFYDRVEQACLAENVPGKALSILLIEIANYKEINDTLGRNGSDSLIKQVAVRLESAFSAPVSIARIDSNIFSLLITDVEGRYQVLAVAESIQRVLDAVFFVGKVKLSAHANVGIVHFPEHGEDVDTLVQRAGIALYVAHNSNKGYAVYDTSFDAHNPGQLTLMSELNQALLQNQMELYYQPKIDISSGRLCGAEALVRWNHPKHGLLMPDNFIPLMERTRIIQSLSIWVLKAGFAQCAAWHKQGLDLSVSINLSAKDLNNPELPDLIAGVAGTSGVDPEWIILEITESSIMSNPEVALEIVNRINDMGFHFSIDDYGTGYSSLSYLKQMPLKELKIDRSFVSDILSDESDAVIVNATINLAHNLGLQVTAEGVENQATLEQLKAEGCDIAQGYLISKPMTVDQFGHWIESGEWQPNELHAETA